MPIFSYEALKQGREIVRGEVTASNLKDARDVIIYFKSSRTQNLWLESHVARNEYTIKL